MSDDYGRKPLLTGSLLMAGLNHLLSGWSIAHEYLGLLIFSRFLAGMMEGNIAIARAMVSDLKLLYKPDAFGKMSAAASVAFLIGPLLGGLMADKRVFKELSASTPFYIISMLFIALAGLTMLVLKNTSVNSPKKIRGFWQRINLIKRLSLLFKNNRLKFLLIISCCFYLAADISYEFGPAYLTVKWTLTPSDLVIYNAVFCLGLVFGNGWLPKWISQFNFTHHQTIPVSIAGFSLIIIIIILTNSTVMMLLDLAICGLFIGLVNTLITVEISNTADDSIQGEVMGVQISLHSLGDGFICLLGGLLLMLSSKLILLFASLLAASTCVYYYTKRKIA
jgi:MFS family permease